MSIKGELLVFYIYDTTDVAYRPVACLTSNSLTETRNIIESQTKCNPGVTTKTSGTYNAEIGLEGEYIDTTSVGAAVTKASHDYIHDIIVLGSEVTWKMDTGLTDDDAYYGTGFVSDLGLDAPAGDELATFSASLSVNGLVVKVDPIV
jgi:hypothetical protein